MPEIRRSLPWLLPLILLLAVLLSPEGAKAQFMSGTTPTVETETETPPPSPNDVRELMRLLSDPSMVEWLRTRSEEADIDGVPGSETAENFQQEVAARIERVRQRLADLAVSWRNLPAAPTFLAEA